MAKIPVTSYGGKEPANPYIFKAKPGGKFGGELVASYTKNPPTLPNIYQNIKW